MSKKILLADDSVVIQKLVGLSFANEDVEIFYTDNGDDAVTMVGDIQPDVVLADVVMPGRSGYEVCEAIRQDPTLAATPVLLLTGTFEAFDEARAAAVGASGQISKPFDARDLVEQVRQVMGAPAQAAAPTLDAAEETLGTPPSIDFFDEDVSGLLPPPVLDETLDALDVSIRGFDDLMERVPSLDLDPVGGSVPSSGAETLAPRSTLVADLDPALVVPADAKDFGFGFDVSEQVATGQMDDLHDDSFPPLMDISELGLPDSVTDTTSPGVDSGERLAASFDVSSSDLATATPAPYVEPLIELPDLPGADPSATPLTGSPELFDDLATGSPLDDFGAQDPFSGGAPLDVDDDLLDPELSLGFGGAAARGVATNDDAPKVEGGVPEPADRAVPDLSPMLEQRVQETLERVAWEAFSDLSESIVKQVIERVERIAWEVIPEMAETLVREEVRKMKGEPD